MSAIEAVLNIYLDLNLLMVVMALTWFFARRLLHLLGMGKAYYAQLQLLRLGFVLMLISPVVVTLMMQFFGADLSRSFAPVNLSDFMVSQYLQGRISLDPTVMESLLSLRYRSISGVLQFGAVAQGLALFAAIGFTLVSARLIYSFCALARVLSSSYRWHRFGRLELRCSDTLGVPFSTRGVWRRYVVVPSHMLTEADDLKFALSHELQHIRQSDVDWEILLAMLRPLFFWNPAYYFWKQQFESLRELSCDQELIRRRGYNVAEYCECLLRVCTQNLRKRSFFKVELLRVPMVPAALISRRKRSLGALKARLFSLTDGRVVRQRKSVVILLMSLLFIATVTMTMAIQKPNDWSQDRLMLSTIINLDRLAQRNTGEALMFGEQF